MAGYRIKISPKNRIATSDICDVGMRKHYISGMIELDVTMSRQKVKKYKSQTGKISFTAWLIKVISDTVKRHECVAGYLRGKRKILIFSDVNVSLIVEKELNGEKIPVPLVIEKADKISIEDITRLIADAKNKPLTEKDAVLHRRTSRQERLYYYLPGWIRRFIWLWMLKHPPLIFSKMGNVAVTSLGMIGNVNGWFIPISVHPLCFGTGSVTRKPVAIGDNVEIREILNMTILVDHDVIDGAPMVRFINELSANIENGSGLSV
jgi:pyruvate/2-oxoglutarate dehydrogenase complex dihydrolipoamide acyltransferase (E2) component